jgi:hypothetical protein
MTVPIKPPRAPLANNSLIVGIGASAGGLNAFRSFQATCRPTAALRSRWSNIYRQTTTLGLPI